MRIKNMLGRYQKMNIKKIDDKTLYDQNRNILIIPYYFPEFFYEDPNALKKLEDDLFNFLVNIVHILSDHNRHQILLGDTLEPRPSFSMYVRYIPPEIDEKLDHLPEPVLYEFAVYLIGRLTEYITQSENLHSYQYFVDEFRDEWLLKSGVFLDV
ncbi:MAG TPA: hypothetical protein VLA74_01515 [Nitrososphaeraceae archaeon]|nr:hypothetical protein [Nitrososphaeraceae archaeon]